MVVVGVGREAPLKTTFAPKNRRTYEVRGVNFTPKVGSTSKPQLLDWSKGVCFGSGQDTVSCLWVEGL